MKTLRTGTLALCLSLVLLRLACGETFAQSSLESLRQEFPTNVAAWGDGSEFRGRKQAIIGFKAWLAEMKTLHQYRLWLKEATLRDDKTATGVVAYDIVYDNVDPRTGKTHRITLKGKEQDTWVLTSVGWRLKRTKILEERFYTDGKIDKLEQLDTRAILAWYARDKTVRETLNADRYATFLQETMTPDSTSIGLLTPGKKSLKQTTDAFRKVIASMKSLERNDYRVQKFALRGKDTAEVTSKYNTHWTTADPDGTTHRMASEEVYRDTWRRTSAGWRMAKTVGLSVKMLKDGKPTQL